MPKILNNFAPLEASTDTVSTFAQQLTSTTESTYPAPQSSEIIIAAPAKCQSAEFQFPFTSAPIKALQQVLSKTSKQTRKSPKHYGFDKEDSSGESTNSCQPDLMQPQRKRSW